MTARRVRARLLERESLAARADFFPFPAMKYPFLSMLLCFPAPGRTAAEVERALLEELARLGREPVTAEELRAAVRPDDLTRMTPVELATELADWLAMSDSWRTLYRHGESKSGVTAEQVRALAAVVYAPNRRTIAVVQ
ncbi:MAG TPA: hypothetical protein DEH78_19805 [Solibacterales bacterium]|nr:hypothetical protein [Bryobacterales bacterium]